MYLYLHVNYICKLSMKAILTYLFLLFAVVVKAQEYNMLDGNPHWVYYDGSNEVSYVDGKYEQKTTMSFTHYYIDGKVLNNGRYYSRLYRDYVRYDAYGNMLSEKKREYVIGVRAEGEKVYVAYNNYAQLYNDISYINPYELTDKGEIAIYDYSIKKGDTIHVKSEDVGVVPNGNPDIVVANSGIEVVYDGSERRFYDYMSGCHIIEGIGSVTDHLITPCPIYVYSVGSGFSHLNIFIQNGEIVYKAPEYKGEPENEKNSSNTYRKDPFFNLETSIANVYDNAKSSAIFDLTGRRLSAKPMKGMYIEGGKVKMAR